MYGLVKLKSQKKGKGLQTRVYKKISFVKDKFFSIQCSC